MHVHGMLRGMNIDNTSCLHAGYGSCNGLESDSNNRHCYTIWLSLANMEGVASMKEHGVVLVEGHAVESGTLKKKKVIQS